MIPIEAAALIEWSGQETVKGNPAKESSNVICMNEFFSSERWCQWLYAVGKTEVMKIVNQSL